MICGTAWAAAEQRRQEALAGAQQDFAEAAAQAHHDQYLEDSESWYDYIPGYPGGYFGDWVGYGGYDGSGLWGVYDGWGASAGFVFGPWYYWADGDWDYAWYGSWSPYVAG